MKALLDNPVIFLWRKMWAYAGKRKKEVIVATLLFLCSAGIFATQPLILAYFLNYIQENGIYRENLAHLFFILFLFLFSEILNWVFWGPGRIIEEKTAFLVKKNYKERLLSGVMALPLSWHADHHSGDTIDKIEKGSNGLFSFSENSFQFIDAFNRIVISFIVLAFMNLLAFAVVIITSFFIFYIIFLYDKKLVPGYGIVNKLENKTSAKVYDTISNITTVIILRVEKLVLKSISKAIDAPFSQFRKNIINNELKWGWAGILGQASVVLAMAAYLFSNVNAGEVILIGSIYALWNYTSRVRETFFSFASLYNDSVRWRSSVLNAEEIAKDFSKIEDAGGKYLPKDWQRVSIKDLSFSYGEGEDTELSLDRINLSFEKGAKIAVIGESGGGKTTFLKLLRGLYAPKNMILEIDSRNYENSFHGISESISLIPQDPEIFSTTIRENITLGIEYSEKEIKHFTDVASFTEVVDRLPRGLESNIVEKGVNLSGGEKQRLALARGLLASKEKDIILLDEPTSSVDFHNELKIYENIFFEFPDKTIISSIHRLHLLSLFDDIFFFKEGKIIARGNLEELKERSKEFQRLWKKYLKTQNQKN